MRLNRVEKSLMNNPVRALLQRYYEAPLLERLGGRLEGKRVLEVGCGRGIGIEILFERFGAQSVYAFDLDPDMVRQAHRRLTAYLPNQLMLTVGDVTAIPMAGETFDAVFDFGIIHHVPEWQSAIAEIGRVLRPGSCFYFEEVARQALERWSYRTFLDHPSENRFNRAEFVAELERHGIVVGPVVERVGGDFFVGVGRRAKSGRDPLHDGYKLPAASLY